MENVENQTVATKQDALKEKLRNRYPDQEFADDDAYSDKISADYDDFDQQLAGYKEREGKITDLFNKDPQSAQFLNDWIGGEDPRVSLLRSFGKEGIMAAFDDPEKMEQMAAADKEFLERTSKEKELEDQYKQNLADSFTAIEQYAQENGYSDEEIDKASEYLVNMSRDVIMGKFTPEALTSAMHALNYDKDVASAEHVGEVRGKNAKIDMKLRKPKGDGMPTLGGGAGAPKPAAPAMPGALGRDKKNIYEAGGEKRTPVKRDY